MFASVQERAAKGAEYLDLISPRWENRVNVFTLNLMFPGDCVIGQLRPGGIGYYEFMVRHGGFRWARRHGFASYTDAFRSNYNFATKKYELLTEAWRTEVARRIVNTIIEEAQTEKEYVHG